MSSSSCGSRIRPTTSEGMRFQPFLHPLVVRPLVLLASVFVASCQTSADPLCEPSAVKAAVEGASAGETVTLGACTIEVSFAIPAGVLVVGSVEDGAGTMIVTGDASERGAVGLSLTSGSSLASVQVLSRGGIGIAMRDGGTLQSVGLDVEKGVGVAMRGGSPVMTDVDVAGSVLDPMDARFVDFSSFVAEDGSCEGADCECMPGEVFLDMDEVCSELGQRVAYTSSYGVYGVGVDATLNAVQVTTTAEAGVVFEDSTVAWESGGVSDVLGTAVLIRGGDVEMTNISVERTVEGLRGLAAYGVIATGGATFASTSLSVRDGERYGILLDGANGTHAQLEVQANGDAGIWIAGASDVLLNDATLSGNAFAGVLVAASENVRIEASRIEGTAAVRRTLGSPFGSREIGDGLHVRGSEVAVRNVALVDNERVGILVDLGGSTPLFEGVDVESPAGALGAIGGEVVAGEVTTGAAAGWDEGIQRGTNATTADGSWSIPVPISVVDLPPTLADQAAGVVPMF